MNENEKDHMNLVAAQYESKRRLKIKQIINTLSEERKKKSIYAIVSGICFTGLVVATHFSGVDANQAIQTEIQALNSFDALKEYLGTFPPAMWGTLVATAGSFSQFLKHRKKYNNATAEFYDMADTDPEYYDMRQPDDYVEKSR